jgi:hypothetical protein
MRIYSIGLSALGLTAAFSAVAVVSRLGDLDGDGRVTVLDLVLLDNYLAGQSSLTPDQQLAADLNQDGVVNQSDAELLANVVLGQAPQPPPEACVILAIDGAGDFGPQTPGTRTAGWQEALNYCVAHQRDLYVQGGFGGNVVFNVLTNVVIPAARNFRIDGGVYVLNYSGPPGIDAVIIDSAQNCDYTFGNIVYQNNPGYTGACVRIQPKNPTSTNGSPAFTESRIRCQGACGNVTPGQGLVFDCTYGPISYSKIYFAAVLNFNTNVNILGNGDFIGNVFVCEHLHSNFSNSSLMLVGTNAYENTYRCGIAVDGPTSGAKGVLIAGRNDRFTIITGTGGFAPASQVILQSSARGNQINLRTDQNLASLLTYQANLASNQITMTGPAPAISTITGTSGTYVYTQRLYPAVVTITSGSSLSVVFRRPGSLDINFGAALSRDFTLSVGDSLVLSSSSNPVLRVVPLKTNP